MNIWLVPDDTVHLSHRLSNPGRDMRWGRSWDYFMGMMVSLGKRIRNGSRGNLSFLLDCSSRLAWISTPTSLKQWRVSRGKYDRECRRRRWDDKVQVKKIPLGRGCGLGCRDRNVGCSWRRSLWLTTAGACMAQIRQSDGTGYRSVRCSTPPRCLK